MAVVKILKRESIRDLPINDLYKIIENTPGMEALILSQSKLHAEVVEFPVVKYAKDGSEKKTPNNQTEDRWADPIREKDDLMKCSQFLYNKIICANRKDTKYAAIRNYTLFIVGTNVGLRVSDLVRLTWDKIFDSDMKTFITAKSLKEKKTGKIKEMIPNQPIMDVINFYLKETDIIPNPNDYIFQSSKKSDKPLNNETVSNFVKEMTSACNIKGDYCARSIRKTYAYQMYMNLLNNGEKDALIIVQKALNHSSPDITARYIGLTRETIVDTVQDMGNNLNINVSDEINNERLVLI